MKIEIEGWVITFDKIIVFNNRVFSKRRVALENLNSFLDKKNISKYVLNKYVSIKKAKATFEIEEGKLALV